ncbi:MULTISPECIES: TetR/AcrR family transcriptional regulator C-terminal domain-containing protein [Streptomyces]|uniref:TetR/AcrR family transcriptional regulator C-terminal domain-containing protein n=1 Tax=Streptomyces TaxID=1883 RepID=UPI000B21BC07|nr:MULTISPECIES: TetR/AcrR family transcriptional regulator C-terminal domain-containing protein [unclassified Streptomyces]MDX3065142.1 TetR/AcrR family transcriptional regulator C-terminal domain-containing protein [Streptomyces sp. ND04-05B]
MTTAAPTAAMSSPWVKASRAADSTLVDAEGLAALSMLRIATEFGTSTMALHRHASNKGKLIRLMSGAVFGRGPDGRRPTGWRPLLEREARRLWKQYERHPWLARAMAGLTRPMASPNAMRYTSGSRAP